MHSQNKKHVHHILARMTYFIEKGSGISSKFEDYISKKIKKPFEIEHIWGDDFDQHKDEYDNKNDFESDRQLLGNLILLPRGFNQSLSNKPYKDKLEVYYSQNLLASSLNEKCYKNNPSFLTFIKNSNLPFEPHKEYKFEDLEKRQILYKEICERVWNLERFEDIIR